MMHASGGAVAGTEGALDGIRVLDLSQVVSGSICSRLLADLGADVVKVEPPTQDILRFTLPQVGDDNASVYFTWANAGKRAITVDVRNPEGADIVRRLAQGCDVVLENFRPGALAQYGLDADTLRAADPRLVYCSVNGWGMANSWSQRRAYAAMVQAEVGRVELEARLRNAPPGFGIHVDGDITPGFLAVSAVLAALFRRERTGRGDHVDVSMAEALLYTDEWTSPELFGYEGRRVPDTWLYPVVETADGRPVAFMGSPHGRMIEISAALTDDPVQELDTYDDAVRTLADLVGRIPDFATLEARLEPFGFLVGEVRTVTEIADTPWAREREVFLEVEPGHRVTAKPFHSAESEIGVRGRAPRFAEHTREVLAERLDFDDATLQRLEATAVIMSRETFTPAEGPQDMKGWLQERGHRGGP